MYKLVLVRHGESTWNQENRFTGWTDVDLTAQGEREAREAGRVLDAAGFEFDRAFTSVLKRAVRTLWLMLDEMDLMWIPIHNDWRLNERHYGALQGLNKAETAAKFGDRQVLAWRRSYDVPPDELEPSDPRSSIHDPRYKGLSAQQIPRTESLRDTIVRVLPAWHAEIAPRILKGERLLISAHGNSLRGLVKYLDGMGDEEIVALNIPNGQPLVYELDAELKPVRHYYLGASARPGADAPAAAAQSHTR